MLVSQVPLHLQNAFRTFSKTTHPNEHERVRLFDRALKDLTEWWYTWFEVEDEKGLKRRDTVEVEQELEAWREVGAEAGSSKFPWEEVEQQKMMDAVDVAAEEEDDETQRRKRKRKGKGKERQWGPSEDNWEPIHGIKSIHKHARLFSGSRDMSAQLFTALCRALDIPSRLVFSLQPVDWRAPSATAKKSGRKKKKKGDVEDMGATTDSEAESRGKKGRGSAATSGRDSAGEKWEDGRGKLTYARPKVNLRKGKPALREGSPTGGEICVLIAPRSELTNAPSS